MFTPSHVHAISCIIYPPLTIKVRFYTNIFSLSVFVCSCTTLDIKVMNRFKLNNVFNELMSPNDSLKIFKFQLLVCIYIKKKNTAISFSLKTISINELQIEKSLSIIFLKI